jgi:hypothetical protein
MKDEEWLRKSMYSEVVGILQVERVGPVPHPRVGSCTSSPDVRNRYSMNK